MPYPSWSEQHSYGRYDAVADLVGGRFRARSSSTWTESEEARAATTAEGIRLTNPAEGTRLVLPAGSITASVSGRYARGVDGEAEQASSTVVSTFTVEGAFSARTSARHEISETQRGGTTSTFVIDDAEGHGTIHAGVDASTHALDYAVILPEITLDPGESITLSFDLTTRTHATTDASSTADFFTDGASISVLLPWDVEIETDLRGPVPWIAHAPAPESDPATRQQVASFVVAATIVLTFAFISGRRQV